MRISVCEFLRVVTSENWFYLEPGHWVNSNSSKKAVRVDSDTFQIFEGEKIVKTLHYFKGKTSYQVRMEIKGRRRKK